MAEMVNIGDKPETERKARAETLIQMQPETLAAIREGRVPKGDVIAIARVAGVMGAKQCPQLLPLCHPLPLHSVDIAIDEVEGGLRVLADCSTRAATGVEMEALTACTAAALCVYDLCKALDRGMTLSSIRLLRKEGGRSGDWRHPDAGQ